MAVESEQALAQAIHAQVTSKLSASWTYQPKKLPALNTSPELDTEQPGTPKRVSSTSIASTGLKMQYSEDDEPSDEQVAVVQPLQRFAAGTLLKQEHKQRAEWTAYKQAVAVVVSCVSWIIISSATILINKHIMVDLS